MEGVVFRHVTVSVAGIHRLRHTRVCASKASPSSSGHEALLQGVGVAQGRARDLHTEQHGAAPACWGMRACMQRMCCCSRKARALCIRVSLVQVRNPTKFMQ